MNLRNFVNWIVVGALGVVGGSALASAPPGATGREYSEILLLLSDSDFDVRLGLKSIRRQGMNNRFLSDLLAEITWQSCSGRRNNNADLLAWSAKILGETRNRRYSGVIDYCLERVTAKGPVKHLTLARAALSDGSPSDPYVGGQVDLDRVRASATKNRKGNPPREVLKSAFSGLRGGQPIDAIYSLLGAPDSMGGVDVRRGRAGFMFVHVNVSSDQIEFRYSGIGEVRFGYDEKKQDWVLADATGSPGMLWIAQLGRFGTQLDLIERGDARDLQAVKKSLMNQVQPIDPGVMDRIVDRLYFSQMEKNGEMVDALAHLCRLIGNSGLSQYKPVLAEIAEKAEHRSLRRHAEKAVKALPDVVGPGYVPKPLGSRTGISSDPNK